MSTTLATVEKSDLFRTDHQRDILTMMDAYSCDIMGAGHPLSDWSRENLIAGLQQHPTTVVFIAYQDVEPVGIATCFLGFSTFAARRLLNISDYFVSPSARGMGVGRLLMQTIEAAAIDLECCRLTLEVQEKNYRARTLYEAAGFSQSMHVPEVGGALYLSKSLDKGKGEQDAADQLPARGESEAS